MPVLNLFRETSLPSTLNPNSIYLIAPTNKPDYVEMYVVGNTSSAVRRIINSDDIQAMIQAQLSGVTSITIVENIDALNTLNPNKVMFALVLDASADPTVNSGSASYVYNPTTDTWIKVAEYESLDLTLTWDNIQGKPLSSPTDIDDAVAKKHSHANMTYLNKISEDTDGHLMYGSNYPKIAWDSTDW